MLTVHIRRIFIPVLMYISVNKSYSIFNLGFYLLCKIVLEVQHKEIKNKK